MPEQVVNNSAPASEYISNALEDMVVGSIGPDQADVRVNVCEYVSFDYAGTRANDPVIAVHMNLTPLDGSNDGKDFDAEWTVGPKMTDFDIVNDGGNLKPRGARHTLAPNSNWAELLKAMQDCSFKSGDVINGPRGIRAIEGMEMTIRRIAQKEREGLKKENDKGRAPTFYTCLKIIAMPGEKKAGASGRRTSNTTSTSTASTASTTQRATATAGGGANGNSPALVGFINTVLKENTGGVSIKDTDSLLYLPRLVFKLAKAAGESAKGATELGKLSVSEDFLYEHAMEHNWSIDNGILTATSAS
jgi:hypothetical protein